MQRIRSSKDVCEALGITYRQLDLWIRSGLMAPSVARAKGYGTARRFNFTDLMHIELIRQLLDARVPLQSIKKTLRHLRAHGPSLEELWEAYLVTDGEGYSVLYYSDHELHQTLKKALQRGRPILSVSIGNVIATVQGKLGLDHSLSTRPARHVVQAIIDQVAQAVTELLQPRVVNCLDFECLLAEVMQKTGAEFGGIYLLDWGRRRLVLRAFRSPDGEPIQDKDEFKIGEAVPGLVAQTGEPIIRTYLAGEPRFMKRARQRGIRFFACIPLKIGNVVLGTIGLASVRPTLPATARKRKSSRIDALNTAER